MNKYEAAPGLFIGSEIGDIDREIKGLMRKLVNGDDSVLAEIIQLSNRRKQLLMPRKIRKR